MKSFVILRVHSALYRLTDIFFPHLEPLWDFWYDKIYAPWYASLPDACDDCPICKLERESEG